MANINSLKERVRKSEDKVLKCRKTIERHEKQLANKIKSGADSYDIKFKENDIIGANKKLRNAEISLEKWQSQLDKEIEKERFLEGNAPKVIKDFLEDWKEKAYDWHVKRYDDYKKLCVDLSNEEQNARIECIKTTPEYAEYMNANGSYVSLYNLYPRKYMDEFLEKKGLDYKSVNAKKNSFAGSTVLRMETFRDEKERLEWLESRLEEDKKFKMLDLVERIHKVAGTITDASNLKIGYTGNLNGFIIGENGKAKVETIGAGGYAIQCFHFRTLVGKMK